MSTMTDRDDPTPAMQEACGPGDSLFRDVLDLIGSKWSVMVISNLDHGGAHRFGELRRAIPEISPRSLTQTLRRLEREGLVDRTVLADKRPPQVVYSLTELGWTVTPTLRSLGTWVMDHMDDLRTARETFDTNQTASNSTPNQPDSRTPL